MGDGDNCCWNLLSKSNRILKKCRVVLDKEMQADKTFYVNHCVAFLYTTNAHIDILSYFCYRKFRFEANYI